MRQREHDHEKGREREQKRVELSEEPNESIFTAAKIRQKEQAGIPSSRCVRIQQQWGRIKQ
jgi:hypothetical protein